MRAPERSEADGLARFMNAIGTIESSNNYNAIGPYTGRLGRAQGRYQIMSGNWSAWAREAGLGPNADWRNPANQDRVARYKMGQYYARYKNWDLVAVAWFAGPGSANRAEREGLASLSSRSDVLGTSVPTYVTKMRQVMGGSDPLERNPSARQSVGRRRPSEAVERNADARKSLTPEEDVGEYGIRPNLEVPLLNEEEDEPEFRDDTFGQILSTISQAASARGGQILDAKQMFGMPVRDPLARQAAELADEDAQAVEAPQAAQEGDFNPGEFKGLAGLDPRFGSSVAALLREAAGKVWIVSGLRSRQQQEALYAKYKAGTGNLAAKPGTSNHEHGAAVDFGGDLDLVAKLGPKYGLKATVRGEPWHWELSA